MEMNAAVRKRAGVICGSLRSGSYNRLLAQCLGELAPANMDLVDLPSIGSLPHFDQDLLDGGVPPAVEAFAAALGTTGGLIVVSPEYNWSMPGVLKNALDWLSRLDPMPLRGMPVLIVTSSPGLLGGARAHAPIRNVLHALDCHILARPEIQISEVATKLDAQSRSIIHRPTADFIAGRLAVLEKAIN